MKKASRSLLVFCFALLFVSLQSFAQSRGQRDPSERGRQHPSSPRTIQKLINKIMPSYERLRLSEILRLSHQEASQLEIRSLNLVAQAMGYDHSQIELLRNGRPIGTQVVRRQLHSVEFNFPRETLLSELEISTGPELYLSSVTAEVDTFRPSPSRPGHQQQVSPHSVVTLQLDQVVRGHATISLEDFTRQQTGLTLRGAQIDRIVVVGQPLPHGRVPSVQAELNHHPVGDLKYLSHSDRKTPLRIESEEEVRSLLLVVNGDAQISEVRIRIGEVRSRFPELPRTQRFYVGQVVHHWEPLELSRILGQQNRRIRSVTIEARSVQQTQGHLVLQSLYNDNQGTLLVGPRTIRATLPLVRPMTSHELKLLAGNPVLIEAIEVEFESHPHF